MAKLIPLYTAPTTTDPATIAAALGPAGITFERWAVPAAARALAERRSLDEADKAALLDHFRAHLAEKADRYRSADVVAIRPTLPGVDGALAKFDRVHFHDDDEVRAIAGGRGVFGFVLDDGRQVLLEVEAGDYLSVPAGLWHWFYCDGGKAITALRLFEDTAGWVPRYRDTARGVPGEGPTE